MSLRSLNHWLPRLLPAPLNIPPKEWLRAGVGALLGLFLAGLACSYAFGSSVALHLLGPLAASAVSFHSSVSTSLLGVMNSM